MIVQPDFPDHWKTRLVVSQTGSESAVRCILRLWGHCQVRRRWIFPELKPAILASICGWDGDAGAFWSAMTQTFVTETDAGFEIHQWAVVNKQLIANWEKGEYGKQGGRGHKKNPQGLPQGLTDKPKANPGKTRLDRIGSERREGEGKPSLSAGADGGSEDGNDGVPAADEAGSDGVPSTDTRTPSASIRDLFHSLCPALPTILKVEGARAKQVAARWRAAGRTDDERMEWFRTLFRMAGESTKIREGSWCSFDWLMSPRNSQKVLEGNYADTRHNGANGRQRRFIN